MVQDLSTSKISQSILNNHNKPAFIPFIVAGYPDFEATKDLLKLFESKNAAAVELGIPFSDPLADGPVIQNASRFALDNGVTLQKVLSLINDITKDVKTPIIIFSYFNPILRFGVEKFIKTAAEAGVSGVIIPDLPIEESTEFSSLCRDNGIDFIMLIAPTSSDERIEKISKSASGFIYLVSSTGVTGVRDTFSTLLADILDKIRSVVKTPVAVGFGVSKSDHIQELKALNVDGAIVGSAIIRVIDQFKSDKQLMIQKMSEYIDSLYKV